MKNIIVTILFLLLTINLIGEVITDELWLKAVKLKSESMNVYPTQTKYVAEIKDKKGNIEQVETIVISHKEEEGKIINSFKEGSNSDGALTEEDDAVQRYMSMDVSSDDEGFFRKETSSDFTLERMDNEILEGVDYAKYKIYLKSKTDDENIESQGFVWLDTTSGVPFKMSLNIDPHKMVIKDFTVDTYFSLSETGFLKAHEVITNITISIIFKKMFITQTMIRENYLEMK